MAKDIQTNPFEKLLYAKKEAEEELSQIVSATNAEALLTCMISQLLLMSPDQNIGDEFGNHPAMLEILAKECIPYFCIYIDIYGRSRYVNVIPAPSC